LLLLNKFLRVAKRLIVLLLLFKNSISQNLIQNHSFENNIGADCIYGGFDNYNATPVYHVVNDWYTLNSSDYFNSICTNTYTGIPMNLFGNSISKTGGAYVGLILFQANGDMKEYIYQYLSSPLQGGKTYCLSFYVSRADKITHSIHSVGAYFSNTIQNVNPNGYINATPQVLNQNSYITDTTSWTQIQGCFTALGGEQYITIGNFNSNANTDTLFVGTNNQLSGANGYAYYYIDDITLIDQTTVGILEESINARFKLFPNPNNGSMHLDYDLGNNSDATMKLYDVTGKLITTYNLLNTKGSLQMNEQGMHNGIYYYHILAGEKLLKAEKIVIIK
jgi:OOP family OmpA-OmpF porin